MAIKVLVTLNHVIDPDFIKLGNRLLDTADKFLAALDPVDTSALEVRLEEAEKKAAEWQQTAEAGKTQTP